MATVLLAQKRRLGMYGCCLQDYTSTLKSPIFCISHVVAEGVNNDLGTESTRECVKYRRLELDL